MNRGSAAFEEGVSCVTATPSVKLGTRQMDGSGNEYIYAYNGGLYQAWPGTPMRLASTTSGYTVTASNAASQAGTLGGVVHHATIPTAYYGWIMTKGLSRVRPDSSTVSGDAGDFIALGVDGGFVSAPASIATSTRKGMVVASMVTCSGASAGSLGKAWIRSDVW